MTQSAISARADAFRIIGGSALVGGLAVTLVLACETLLAGSGASEWLTVGIGMLVGGVLGLFVGVLRAAITRLPTGLALMAWPAAGLVWGFTTAWRVGAVARLGDDRYRSLALGVLAGAALLGLFCGLLMAVLQPTRRSIAVVEAWIARCRLPLVLLALVAGIALAVFEARTAVLINYPAMQTMLRLCSWLAVAAAVAALLRAYSQPLEALRARPALRTALALGVLLCAALALASLAGRTASTIAPSMARNQMRLAIEFTRFLTDVDRDGYSALFGGGDCAPWNADISPGAKEVPGNGIDDNCQRGDAPIGTVETGDLSGASLPSAPSPCSVVLVTIDSVRQDRTSLAGYPRDTTPTLRALAKTGTWFANAFTAGTWTSIAVSTLFRGRYPRYLRWTGIYETDLFRLVRPAVDTLLANETVRIMFALPLDDKYATLTEWLARRGMRTMAVVNDGVSEFLSEKVGSARGFAIYRGLDDLPLEERTDAVVVDEALRMMATVPSGEPFFLWLHLFAPHLPQERHPGAPDFGDGFFDDYDEEIWYADSQLGRVVDALSRRAGLPVGIVVAVDHGEKFGSGWRLHGVDLSEESVRVPMIISGCGFERARVDAPVSLIDLAPTILGMTSTPAPSWLDGVDLGKSPPPTRMLHTDLWRFAADGSPTLDMSGATDGKHMLTLDLLANTLSVATFAGQKPATAEERAALEDKVRAYLEETGGRLRPH